jgi:hypothetical protein
MIKDITINIINENDIKILQYRGRSYHYEGSDEKGTALDRAVRQLKYEFIKYYKKLLIECKQDISVRFYLKLIGNSLEKVTSEQYVNELKIEAENKI